MREPKGKERINLFVTSELSEQIYKVAEDENSTISDVVREAIKEYISKIENAKINRELEEGYKANYNYYLKSQDEWDYADKD
ncbi:MAG: hypothetical protein HUU54_03615 [Ignavibacteriaceae bacterium]|nr:hypothetical protein [Ignavibacteriaceae bacterium]